MTTQKNKAKRGHKHQFIGVTTIEGYRWCKPCDKWIKINQRRGGMPAKKKVIEGYCPKGFEKNFKWQTKKNLWGSMTTYFFAYVTKDTPLKDKEGFIKVRVTIEELGLPKPKGKGR